MKEKEIIQALPILFQAVPEAPAAKEALRLRLFGAASADGRTLPEENKASRQGRKVLIMPKKNSPVMGGPKAPILTEDELFQAAGGNGGTDDYKAQAEADGRRFFSHDRPCGLCGQMAVYYKSSVEGPRGPTYLDTKCYACGHVWPEIRTGGPQKINS